MLKLNIHLSAKQSNFAEYLFFNAYTGYTCLIMIRAQNKYKKSTDMTNNCLVTHW